jgi:hypothetical protein
LRPQNKFAALADFDVEIDINSAWKMNREIIRFSVKDGPWFSKVCLKLLDQRKEVKRLWLQDPREIIGDNQNNVRLEASRHFRNRKREYLREKINEP